MLDFIFNRKFLKLKKEIAKQINYFYEQEKLYAEVARLSSEQGIEVGEFTKKTIEMYRTKRKVLVNLLVDMCKKK